MHFGTKLVHNRLYKTFILIIITAGVSVGTMLDTSAETKPSPEYLIKAAFLFNFTKFVEWPAESFKNDLSPFNLCILGADPFGPALDTIKDKTVKGRQLKIRRVNKVNDMEGCHILFISASEKENLKHILNFARNSNILTVSEIEGFAQLGGIINFIIIDKKVQFEINPDAAQHSKLKISSQLLKLAKIVTSEPKKEKE